MINNCSINHIRAIKQNELSLSQSQCIIYLIKPYSTLPHACYVSALVCIHSRGYSTAAQATDSTFNTVSKRDFSFVHGTHHHYNIRCVIRTVLRYTLGRARLIFLKTPAALMNAMIYKTEAWKRFTIISMVSQACRDDIVTVYLSIPFLQKNHFI